MWGTGNIFEDKLRAPANCSSGRVKFYNFGPCRPLLRCWHPLLRVIQMNETYQQPGKWHEIKLPAPRDETFTHAMSYTIKGLEHESVFEAIVQAKNKYGWNEVSDLYQFYTTGKGKVLSICVCVCVCMYVCM
jgi:hypothetical protein